VSASPFSTSVRSAFSSVSASRTITMSSVIVVRAFVGPRPVYSLVSFTTALEMAAAVVPTVGGA
jgi:hypothetical protein